MYYFAERFSTLMARIAGFAVLLTALVIAVEVTARKLFHVSLVGADEISGYVLAITVTWGASLALIRRAHVRIDVVQAHLPRFFRVALDILALLSLLSVTLLFAWYATRLLHTNIRTGAVSNTQMEVPMWIPQSLWVAGFWIFAAIIVIVALSTLHAMVARDFGRAHHVAGMRGALEESSDETAEARARR
ncbi:MAG: TRAP transporter small permease [Rhodobacteraceae bacterium]|nr:TRAP transporter small permease [Paracoccaceae bacterium]